MGNKKIVRGSDLTPDWLEKYLNIKDEIEQQVLRGVKEPGKGLSLDQLQLVVEHKNPFSQVTKTISLNFNQLKKWLRQNNLERFLPGGLEGQIAGQEKFYQNFYGKNFRLNRNKIFIKAERLPAIKLGMETGALNYGLVVATPSVLTEEEQKWTEAEFAYHRLLVPQKKDGKDGLKIWAETGTDRWSNLTLTEVLAGYIPVTPEDFNFVNLKEDWKKEIQRVIGVKGPAPKQTAGKVELIFTDSRQDVPANQALINAKGDIINNIHSFVDAITNSVRFLTPEQEIVLAAQYYFRDKTYLSPNTWDWESAVLDHKGKKNDPHVSAASADSNGGGFSLNSGNADGSDSDYRLRSAL